METQGNTRFRFWNDPEIRQAIISQFRIRVEELQAGIRAFRQLGIDPLPILREVLGSEIVVPENDEKPEEMLAPGSPHWALEQMLSGQKVRRRCWNEEDEEKDIISFLAIQDGLVYAFSSTRHFENGIGFAGEAPEEWLNNAVRGRYAGDNDWIIYTH